MDIIFSSLILLFGICFIVWGIYQIKTNKMVAKRKKNPIDEPREVGVIFLTLGLNMVFYFAPCFCAAFSDPLSDLWVFANEMAIFTAPLLAILNTAFFLFVAFCAFSQHKILGLKSDKTTKKSIEKFRKPVAIFALLRGLIFPLERIFIVISTFSIGFAEFSANAIIVLELFFRPAFLIVLCVFYLLVYKQSRQPKKAKKVAKTRKK